MRKFNISVNGKSYEVEVEELGSVAATYNAPAPTAPISVPAPASAPTVTKVKEPVKTEVAAAVVQGGETISSPMPGTILEVNVKPGDDVKRGQVMLILEAMKMENEIMAPLDGKVAQVGVTKGQSVDTGDMLVVIA